MKPRIQSIKSYAKLEGFFESPAFELMADHWELQRRLFEALNPCGLALSDLSAENIAGPASEVCVTATLHRVSTVVRVLLDRIEVSCYDYNPMSQPAAYQISERALRAFASHLKLVILSFHTHLALSPVSAPSYLQTWVARYPDKLGPGQSSGVSFSLGPDGERLFGEVSLELSALHADALFLKCLAGWKSSEALIGGFPQVAERYILKLVEALELEPAGS